MVLLHPLVNISVAVAESAVVVVGAVDARKGNEGDGILGNDNDE